MRIEQAAKGPETASRFGTPRHQSRPGLQTIEVGRDGRVSDGQASPIRRFEYQQYAQNRVNKMRTNTTMKLTALAAAIGTVMSSGIIAD